jgi:hypothetical protein
MDGADLRNGKYWIGDTERDNENRNLWNWHTCRNFCEYVFGCGSDSFKGKSAIDILKQYLRKR